MEQPCCPASDRGSFDMTMIGRRAILKGIGAGAVLLGAGQSLAGCAAIDPNVQGGVAPSGPPRRGGTLRIGASGGASNDTLDAHNPLTNTDFARLAQLYDPLLRVNHKGEIQFVLATEITPDATGSVWTIKLKDGVKFHNGANLTADDVLFSFQRIIENKFFGSAYLAANPDFKASRAIDATTLRLAFEKPNAIFTQTLAAFFQFYIVPRGYDPAKPIGSGPFKFQSFRPGVESTFVRFDEYWDEGKPYLDSIVTLNMSDETTQVNALQSGQVDAVNYMSAQSLRQLRAGGAVVTVSKTGGWAPITMRTDQAPFNDVRVRQAMRLLVDRQQMLDIVFSGNGSVGNDVFGITDPLSTFEQTRPRDVEQAKSLLRAAGHSDLQVELVSNDVTPFQRSVAQIFAQQAKDAGVQMSIKNQTASDFFATSYLKVPLSQDYWFNLPYLTNVAGATVSNAAVNATHFNDPEYDKLYAQAAATTNGSTHKQIVADMQRIDFERGGNIIPFFYPQVDATSTKVGGIVTDVSGFPFGNYEFTNIWMTT